MRQIPAARGAVRRRRTALALSVVTALGLTQALASASAAPDSPAHGAPVVKVAKTYVGPLLVNKTEHTIYMFVRDKRRKDDCLKIKGCEKDWPAVTTTGKPVGGPGVKKALLGSIPYKGGLREVTYKGYPLHTYVKDDSKRDVLNIGIRQFGGAWYALNPKGHLVK